MGAALDDRAVIDDVDPMRALEDLAAVREPLLIGVRHHSPVLANAIPALLDAAAPDLVLVEMPEEMQPWLSWLGAAELQAPVALSAVRADGRGLLFYPFADFSPELAAVRWAVQHDVPIEAFDLPVGLAPDDSTELRTRLAPDERAPLSEALGRQLEAPNSSEVWDRLVEGRAAGAEPEQVRRAALAVGWALRLEQATWGEVPRGDLQREAWMRSRIVAARSNGKQRLVAVVGAFHAPALTQTDQPTLEKEISSEKERSSEDQAPAARRGQRGARPSAARGRRVDVVTSLIPYAFELLDSRTGYPAGIRDPEWQQAYWSGGCTPEAASGAASAMIVRICRELRDQGHAASVPDAREATRLATDLAHLRGLAAPGRRELIEAIQSGLAQGEPLGRGRVVASAMQRVLVGRRRGQLAPGTPRSGLVPHAEEVLRQLRFPGPRDAEPVEVRLDPLRSPLDRRRHIAIQRLRTCRVPYAEPLSVESDRLTGRWLLRWGPSTSALLELAGQRGVTLAHAAEGFLRTRLAEAERDNRVTVVLLLAILEAAAECSLAELAAEALEALPRIVGQATLEDLVRTIELVDRIARGHVPGFSPEPSTQARLTSTVLPELIGAALRQLEGLAGSERVEDAQALLALVQRLQRGDGGALVLGDSRLRWSLEAFERDGSPLMQGAGGAVRVLLGHASADEFGQRMGSWVDAAGDSAGQRLLAKRMLGTLLMAAPLLEAAPSVTEHLIARVARLDDAGFLQRLPALRDAFDVLSPAARQRFLGALEPTLSARFDPRLDYPPALLGQWADADHAGRAAALALDAPLLEVDGAAP